MNYLLGDFKQLSKALILILNNLLSELYISKNLTHLLYIIIFYEKKFTENNTIFQTRYHNFRILQVTEMGLRLSESQINCASSDVQHFDL